MDFLRIDGILGSEIFLLTWCDISWVGRESTHPRMSARRQPIADRTPAPFPRRIGLGNSGSNHCPSESKRFRMVDGLKPIWAATSSMRNTSLGCTSHFLRESPIASRTAWAMTPDSTCVEQGSLTSYISRLCGGDAAILRPNLWFDDVRNPHFHGQPKSDDPLGRATTSFPRLNKCGRAPHPRPSGPPPLS